MKTIFLSLFLFLYTSNLSATSTDIIKTIYDRFENQYIKKDIVQNLAFLTISSLKNIDKNITIANDKERISLYYKTKKRKIFLKPKTNNSTNWATLTNEIIKEAAKISPIIKHKEYQVKYLLLNKSVKDFDTKENSFQTLSSGNKSGIDIQKTFTYKNNDGVLYIKAQNINNTTKQSISEVIKNNPDAKELIIDLKDNSGGSLQSATQILNLFLDEGIMFTTKNRDGNYSIHQATSGDIFNYKPISILVNEQTASSAELIAYTLNFHGRAKIVGNKTYNKNSIQTQYIVDGKKLSITTDYFYDANGRDPISILQYQQNP